jgi:hypothetical protein
MTSSVKYGTYKREGAFVFLGPFRSTAEEAIAFCCEENRRLGHDVWDIYTVDAPFTPHTGMRIYTPEFSTALPARSGYYENVPGEDCLDDCAP